MQSLHVHVIQPVKKSGLGHIESWLAQQQATVSVTRLYNGEAPPKHANFDWLILLGGPMNVYQEEEYPWLISVKQLIKHSIEQDKIIFGICLGAQLAAVVLGANVTENPHEEVGWFDINFNESAQQHPLFSHFGKKINVLQWHGDTFATPENAMHVASSAACLNQGFVFPQQGKPQIVGLQCHMEWTPDIIDSLLENLPRNPNLPFVQTEQQMKHGDFITAKQALCKLLEKLYQSTLKV
ncbi:type 1 glutamine amidotransferase [Flocculibacter collagenilyticus]|uniref:type 1 glutamine amidotransferase n=1 Tax=Flocculibacter collagenilyticus TaxID=2744479 RepID=UPI0018F73807|nr:type 1 glutamine amidotransferase [Flocculibacter collagenilyticus]